jgi:hypothetical protein
MLTLSDRESRYCGDDFTWRAAASAW